MQDWDETYNLQIYKRIAYISISFVIFIQKSDNFANNYFALEMLSNQKVFEAKNYVTESDCGKHRLYSLQITHFTYRLWSPMLRFVFDKLKMYNVRERTLNRGTPYQRILWTFEGYYEQPGVSML